MSNAGFVEKIPVIILGATGSVGQRFVALLADHPWFVIAGVAASERSVGKTYGEAVHWLIPSPLPEKIASLKIETCDPLRFPVGRVAFSALDSSVAASVEKDFAHAGYLVVSNTKNHRMEPDVPLLIPEVNSSHLGLLQHQKFVGGKIITNPNCSAIGFCLALKPIHDRFGIESVHVVTMQAISGAGYPGVPSLEIMDNVIPYIADEEKKLESEPLKIFGSYLEGKIMFASMKISAQCNRVPVIDGHTESISIQLKKKASKQDLIDAWNSFPGLQLPSAPVKPLCYFTEEHFPQPRLHRDLGGGMSVSIGRLRECPILDYKFTILSHNTVRGAAGGAILCAEQLVASWDIATQAREK